MRSAGAFLIAALCAGCTTPLERGERLYREGDRLGALETWRSAEDNLELHRFTVGGGDAIHAGISAKDAIVVTLTGSSTKSRDHATAAKELARTLGQRADATVTVRALRELISARRTSRTPQIWSMRPRRPCWSGAPARWSIWPSRLSN